MLLTNSLGSKLGRLLFFSRQTYVNGQVSLRMDLGQVLLALERHRSGDWGNCSRDELLFNQNSLSNEGLVFSRFESNCGFHFYIVTDLTTLITRVRVDRHMTTAECFDFAT